MNGLYTMTLGWIPTISQFRHSLKIPRFAAVLNTDFTTTAEHLISFVCLILSNCIRATMLLTKYSRLAALTCLQSTVSLTCRC